VVRGLVQGVGFRYAIVLAAQSRRVAGWVRNRGDGAVEAVFEGEPEAVEAMLSWARRGPSGARVDEMSVDAEPPEGLRGFAVR